MALCSVLTTRFFSISGIFHRSILSHYFLLFWPFLLLHDFPSFLAAWWFDWLWPTDSVMRSQNSSSPAPLWWSNGRGGDLCLRQILPFHPPFSSSLFVADLPPQRLSVFTSSCVIQLAFRKGGSHKVLPTGAHTGLCPLQGPLRNTLQRVHPEQMYIVWRWKRWTSF